MLRLVAADGASTVFAADDPSFDVQRIVYRSSGPRAVDVEADRIDADGPYVVRFTMTKTG